jgi:hypothetical protein
MPRKTTLNLQTVLQDLQTGKKTMTQIAQEQGVSRQRIKQVALKHGIKAAVIKRIKKAEELNAKYAAKWGAQRLFGSDLYDAQRHKYCRKKVYAKQVGIDFSISFGEIDWPSHCPILGLELDYFAEKTKENSPSFDRIDSTKGYVTGNVVIVSWRANRIKNNGSAEEHRKIAEFLDKIK